MLQGKKPTMTLRSRMRRMDDMSLITKIECALCLCVTSCACLLAGFKLLTDAGPMHCPLPSSQSKGRAGAHFCIKIRSRIWWSFFGLKHCSTTSLAALLCKSCMASRLRHRRVQYRRRSTLAAFQAALYIQQGFSMQGVPPFPSAGRHCAASRTLRVG